MDESERRCVWDRIFRKQEQNEMVVGFVYFVAAATLCALWMNRRHESLLEKTMNNRSSYMALSYYFMGAQMRTVSDLLSHVDILRSTVSRLMDPGKFFGYLHIFTSVFEVEALTHACVERYVVAKYVTKGWTLLPSHYILYERISWLCAIVFTGFPLLGYGQIGHDFSCNYYSFDMWKPSSITLSLFVARSIKPAAVMIFMMTAAIILESVFDENQKKKTDLYFTQVVKQLAIVNLTCWAPLAIAQASVIISQLLKYKRTIVPDSQYISWAYCIGEMGPVFSAITMYLAERKVKRDLHRYEEARRLREAEE